MKWCNLSLEYTYSIANGVMVPGLEKDGMRGWTLREYEIEKQNEHLKTEND